MTQNQLSINYLEEKKTNKITNYAGVLPILDFCNKINIFQFADKPLQVRSEGDQGWLDSQHFLSTLLINFIGGNCISDVDILESDTGLKSAISNKESIFINTKRKFISNRFRKGRTKVFPSNNALHNYALEFHNASEEEVRKGYIERKEAFIPKLNDNFKKLNKFFGHLATFAQKNNPVNSATIKNTNKQSAFYTYKRDSRGYQPLNAYWHEQQMVLFSEFRDGNVNPNYNIPEFVKKSFSYIPNSVKKRYLRSDSAGYNLDLMSYCEKNDIKYSIRVIVTNRTDLTGEELFHWHNKRCGYSEQIHSVMKSKFAGSRFPSGKFGANAFWWIMMIFSLNIVQLYKNLILDNSWKTRRMKAFRLHLVYLAGRVTTRAKDLFIYIRKITLFKKLTRRIENLRWSPI